MSSTFLLSCELVCEMTIRLSCEMYKQIGMAENIAAGQTTPLDVTMTWINSDLHRANILGSFSLLGVGYFPKLNSKFYIKLLIFKVI